MAEEILLKEILSTEQIAAGEELLRRLDHAEADIIAAYWVYIPAVAEWHLEFVSPQVEKGGPLEFYGKVNYLLSTPSKIDHLVFNTIMVLGPTYSFYKLLQAALKSEKDLSGVRLNRVLVGSELMDFYIYRFSTKR
jgi:hypothetical protein